MFQVVLIPEGWGLRAGVRKGVGGGDSFLSLGKIPFRTVCQPARTWGLLWSWDGRRVSLSHGRRDPYSLHLIEISMAMRDEQQKSSL